MTRTKTDLTNYYQLVQQTGKLRTEGHAQRWTTAILATLGINLDRKTKKQLAQALPQELADQLVRVFWLAHFRDTSISGEEFLNQISRRSGNTDIHFARYPTLAVFKGIKQFISPEITAHVSEALSPEVRQLWQQA